MNKKQALETINKKIDKLIIDNKTDTAEYKRLCELHYKIVCEMGLIIK